MTRILFYLITGAFFIMPAGAQQTTPAPQTPASLVEKKQIEEVKTATKVKNSYDSINQELTKLIKQAPAKKTPPVKKSQVIIKVIYRDTCYDHAVFTIETPAPADTVEVIPEPKKRSWIHNVFKPTKKPGKKPWLYRLFHPQKPTYDTTTNHDPGK